MKVEQLVLKNFHGFKETKFNFSEQFTVLIGENATGKTAILDGLAVAIGGFLSGIEDVCSRNIRSDEVRLEKFEKDWNDCGYSFPYDRFKSIFRR